MKLLFSCLACIAVACVLFLGGIAWVVSPYLPEPPPPLEPVESDLHLYPTPWSGARRKARFSAAVYVYREPQSGLVYFSLREDRRPASTDVYRYDSASRTMTLIGAEQMPSVEDRQWDYMESRGLSDRCPAGAAEGISTRSGCFATYGPTLVGIRRSPSRKLILALSATGGREPAGWLLRKNTGATYQMGTAYGQHMIQVFSNENGRFLGAPVRVATRSRTGDYGQIGWLEGDDMIGVAPSDAAWIAILHVDDLGD